LWQYQGYKSYSYCFFSFVELTLIIAFNEVDDLYLLLIEVEKAIQDLEM